MPGIPWKFAKIASVTRLGIFLATGLLVFEAMSEPFLSYHPLSYLAPYNVLNLRAHIVWHQRGVRSCRKNLRSIEEKRMLKD